MRDGMQLALGWLRAEDERAGLVQREQRPSATLLDKAAWVAVRAPARMCSAIGLDLPAKKAEAARKASTCLIGSPPARRLAVHPRGRRVGALC